MSERDPINAEITGRAVQEWLKAVDRDEADIVIEKTLIEQGVLSPADVIEEMSADVNGMTLIIDSGEMVRINVSGNVTVEEE